MEMDIIGKVGILLSFINSVVFLFRFLQIFCLFSAWFFSKYSLIIFKFSVIGYFSLSVSAYPIICTKENLF